MYANDMASRLSKDIAAGAISRLVAIQTDRAAIAAGVTSKLWKVSDIVDVIEAWESVH
jgi:hypothetical protein